VRKLPKGKHRENYVYVDVYPPECKEKYQIKNENISFETAAKFKYLEVVADQNLIREVN
jgi:hypothetical protein